MSHASDSPGSAPVPPALCFTPVPCRPRIDGWTPERQRAFIAALARSGSVARACALVGLSRRSAYKLRDHPGGQSFRLAWDAARDLAFARRAASYRAIRDAIGGRLSVPLDYLVRLRALREKALPPRDETP